MRNFNSSKVNDIVLNGLILVIQLFVGISMLTHGLPKLEMLTANDKIEFMNFLGLGSVISLVLVVFAEVLCSVFIIVGFLTRFSTVPLMMTMLIAFFVRHGSDPYVVKELSLVYFFFYLTIFVLGSGKFSLDWLFSKKEAVY
ncbi:DoxX family protein [Epilithonimonas ginsengisoli]|uniref:DoxX family protein n=1 Tax=Epilithonimonas ginsengisoli TaxID=1245592 RepID=A0ABU4JG42_9FLAO|nr:MULTISPECIES: DoxX family protein [Chryseobacterium group]MBV6880001.1 DoxX family protein [Epilithonimonas sp. FP105]MDW8548651.1 DoxX family protein [Epilithonimonas ginsengisoli]